MTRTRPFLFACVAAGALLAWSPPVQATRSQTAGSRPGIGVSGIGVTSVFVPAPGVAAPAVRAPTVTTKSVTGNPGVTSRGVTTPMTAANPGVSAPGVASQHVTTPDVTTVAPGVNGLPSGYYTSIPPDAVQVMRRGEMVYSAKGVYYRPEYFMGSVVYVRIT